MKTSSKLALALSLMTLGSGPALAGEEGEACRDCTHATPRARTPRPDAPALGRASAPVTIEVWSDFECRFCAVGAERVAELRRTYGDSVRIVFRHRPLPAHESAKLAAFAAMAAGEQGKFWQFHDALFARHGGEGTLSRAGLEALASELGLNLRTFRTSLDSGRFEASLAEESREAEARGVPGTPTYFINGKPLVGAQPLSTFREMIDPLLARK